MILDIKLVALDMDGTLLNSEASLSDYTKKTITKALDQGIYVVLSTGRTLDLCYSYAEELNLNSYLVTANGGEIWTMDKSLLERHLLDPTIMEKVYSSARHFELFTWMASTKHIYYNERPDDFLAEEWLKIGAESTDAPNLEAFIKEVSHYEGLEMTNSLATNVEINPKGVSKASALERICDEIGITMKEVMSVGDSLNDMKMIQASGIGVAMKNGQEAIRNAADHMTDTNDHDGAAKAIETFVLK